MYKRQDDGKASGSKDFEANDCCDGNMGTSGDTPKCSGGFHVVMLGEGTCNDGAGTKYECHPSKLARLLFQVG